MKQSFWSRAAQIARNALTGASTQIQLTAPPQRKKSVKGKLLRLSPYSLMRADIAKLDLAVSAAEYVQQPRRYELYEIYRDTMRDIHLLAQVRVWREKVLSERWVFLDPTKPVGKRFMPELVGVVERAWFYKFCRLAMDSILWGHSLIEFEAEPGMIQGCDLVYREHVRPEYGDLIVSPWDSTGIPYRDTPLMKYLIEVGEHEDLGLLLVLSRAVIKKRYSDTDWLQRNDRYGQPGLVIRTDSDDQAEIDAKEAFARNFGTNAYAILDTTDQIDLVESNQAFTYQTFRDYINLMDEYISKLLVGAVLGEDSGSGSRAKEEVGERTMDTIALSTMRWLTFVVNDLLMPFLRRWGYSIPEGVQFAFYATTAEAEQEKKEERMGGAANQPAEPGQQAQKKNFRLR